MWLDQCCQGVEIRNFEPRQQSEIYAFLKREFLGGFNYNPFTQKFFVSDSPRGRSETLEILRSFSENNNLKTNRL